MEPLLEERFNAFKLGISWEVVGYLDRPDLDAVMTESKISAAARCFVVYLWKCHPNRIPGKIYLRLIIVAHINVCLL
jgi:hypothetical protein